MKYAEWLAYVGVMGLGGLSVMIVGGVTIALLRGLYAWLRTPKHYHDQDAFNRLRYPPRRTWKDAERDWTP